MKDILRKICSPILNIFESHTGEYAYKKSHRVILIIVGIMFCGLSAGVLAVSLAFNNLTALLPCLVFVCVGATCLIVGCLGTDRAVAKIWGSKAR